MQVVSDTVIRRVVATAEEAIALVDQAALAQYTAVKSPDFAERVSTQGAQAAANQKKEMEEMKAGFTEALAKKCLALSAAAFQVCSARVCAGRAPPSKAVSQVI